MVLTYSRNRKKNKKKIARKKEKRERPKVKRTREERNEDILAMLAEISKLEIPTSYEPFQEILTKCNEYIDNGEYAEGVIQLPAYNRAFVYMFPEYQPGQVQAMLKFTGKKSGEKA
jgi:hypothetical protein